VRADCLLRAGFLDGHQFPGDHPVQAGFRCPDGHRFRAVMGALKDAVMDVQRRVCCRAPDASTVVLQDECLADDSIQDECLAKE
jgi:hypothetical protein